MIQLEVTKLFIYDLEEDFVRNKDYTKNSKLVCRNLKDKNKKFIINLYRFIDGKNYFVRDASINYN